ncbi:MAG: alpha/beta fold hydrolase [Caulobacteraceae bacterium]
MFDRREALAGGLAAAGALLAKPAAAQEADFFPGFKPFRIKTSGAEINGVVGGSGPPLLLLHGAPQTHLSWRLVAPKLMASHTLVIPDLRGYGDSSKPADGDNHAGYSKRAMAQDQIETMQALGFERFPVVGHDRGGRVAHRLGVDHPKAVSRIMVLDILPAHYLYNHFSVQFVQAYQHWFTYLRNAPAPENELLAANKAALARATDPVRQAYLRAMTDMATIHAMCEDYRASATIDLEWDAQDLAAGRKLTVPLRTLWAEKGALQPYDVAGIWKTYAAKVSGRSLPGGHSLQEDLPDMIAAEIQDMLKA